MNNYKLTTTDLVGLLHGIPLNTAQLAYDEMVRHAECDIDRLKKHGISGSIVFNETRQGDAFWNALRGNDYHMTPKIAKLSNVKIATVSIKECFDNADFTPLFKHMDELVKPTPMKYCSSRIQLGITCVGINCINCPLRASNEYLYGLYKHGVESSKIFLKCAERYRVHERDLIGNLSGYSLPLAQLIFDTAIAHSTLPVSSLKAMQEQPLSSLFEFTDTPQGKAFWDGVSNGHLKCIDEQCNLPTNGHINTPSKQENKSNTNYNHEPLKFKTNGKFTHL